MTTDAPALAPSGLRIVVPVKQVPQAAALRFDAERGRAVREGVPLVLNAYDRRALGEAVRLRGELGGTVMVVTLGSPRARDALEECLRLGADHAVHLSDPAFAGGDTLATARALAAAIRRLGADLVLCGQRSVDAETGVVGPMLAALLGLPFATAVVRVAARAETAYAETAYAETAYVETAYAETAYAETAYAETAYADRFLEVERLTDVGTEALCLPLPCLLTAAERLHRPDAAPSARAAGTGTPTPPTIQTWTAADLGLRPDEVGAAGALTRVRRIVAVERPRRREILRGTSDEVIGRLAEALLTPSLDSGRTWAVEGSRASALVLSDPHRPWATRCLARMAARAGVRPDVTVDAAEATGDLEQPVQQRRPTLVLATDGGIGRDVLATVAARLGLALVTGVEDVRAEEGGGLVFVRPAWGGGVLAEVEALTVPALATVRPEALAALGRADGDGAHGGEADGGEADGDGGAVDGGLANAARLAPALALETADVVIGVGTGIGGMEGLALVERLARLLGAAVGGTRKVVDGGWLPPQQQIGLSGRQVAPRVYLALGARGSFNHAVGIRRAATILAVNADPRSEIFGECDLGVVGDWREVVSGLMERLERRQRV